jgi:hypothetical protein
VPVVPDGIRSPMSLNSNSSATAVYGTVTSGAVNWTDAKGNEVVWRKLGYTSAPSATPADYLVRTDLVTLFDANPPTAGVKPATRYWTGSAWADPGTVIDGNLLVKGTVTMDALKSGSTIGTSGVSFGLGISWGPGTAVRPAGTSTDLVGAASRWCATTWRGLLHRRRQHGDDDSSGAAVFVGGGVERLHHIRRRHFGRYYTTQRLPEHRQRLAAFSATADSSKRALVKSRAGQCVSAGRFSHGNYTCILASASEAAKAAYSTTQVVYLGTSANAIDITAGTFQVRVHHHRRAAQQYSYLDGTGTWRDLTLDGTSSVTSNFTACARLDQAPTTSGSSSMSGLRPCTSRPGTDKGRP